VRARPTELDRIDLGKVKSTALRRLIEEVHNENPRDGRHAYDRVYHRPNRS